ncbi:MAG: FKBP-type peptidyl-prolyl cis-trans isomerase [Spartobacteria bacterium]|nr:FKBP-type peptidyl-prolyl cis-trans isomerase [Spartobacteria bacterium]
MIVPAEPGYGETGTPDGSIPPNATIVFVVDLVGVN